MAATPTLEIELDPGPWPQGDWANYRAAGGNVSGALRVNSPDPLECRAVRISIGWHTEGRGDKDEAVIFEETVHRGPLHGEHSFRFSTPLPAGPVSYAGKYITIVWQAAAAIDLAWKRDPHTEQTFFVTLP